MAHGGLMSDYLVYFYCSDECIEHFNVCAGSTVEALDVAESAYYHENDMPYTSVTICISQ